MALVKIKKGNEILRVSDDKLQSYLNSGYVKVPSRKLKIELKEDPKEDKNSKNGKDTESKLKNL